MAKEYDRLAEAFDWDDGVFGEISKTSAEGSFCDAATRNIIMKKLEKYYA